MKPVLFVTGHAPPDRVGAFAALHEREEIEVALFGGRSKHGGGEFVGELPFPHRYIRQHEPARLAASGDYRAVVCSTGGRVALGATWAGARRGRVPLILWASLWAHPRSPAHLFSYLALLRLYRSADAVVTYGPHVSEYVRARGARNVHVAPQAVDNSFWSAPFTAIPCWPTTGSAGGAADRSQWPKQAGVKFMFAGRPGREKGVGVLMEAWRKSGLQAPSAALVLVGLGSSPPWVPAAGAVGLPGVSYIEPVPPERLREMYADADVLVVPSIRTPTFREPWGLVINEAMNRGLAIIASDAVGAVEGGLVRDGHNGLVVAAGDSDALAEAMVRLAHDPELRARLGEAATRDVSAYTYDAWADGFSRALATVGLSRTHC
ncbi:MAG: glycosyltransferase family 4 protein [Solirubrobacteraceae bacterium]|jgi:glycosyltransferase involved in cell wall biosynthesis